MTADPLPLPPDESTQGNWQDIARRLRWLADRGVRCLEGQMAQAPENDAPDAGELDKLASACWQILLLEKAAANYDTAVRRDGGGFA